MKLKLQAPARFARRSALRSLAAFTMIEIALSLAVIGFALVAIIGVLPAGMSVQRNNREETLINFDAAFLIDSLRSGASNTIGLGPNDLTNYVLSITNISTVCLTNGAPDGAFPQRINWFTTTNYSLNGTVVNSNLLTNGAVIVGLLSTPKYISFFPNQGGPRIISNLVTADFRTISGAAVDQGASRSSRDFAFSYRVTVEVIPSANYPFFDPNWVNVSAFGTDINGLLMTNPSPAFLAAHANDSINASLFSKNMQGNLNEIRLRFRWPVLGNGSLGGGRQVYRTVASGTNSIVPNFLIPKLTNYFMQPQAYQLAP
jgi:type II secretory pathway pseudopilin PulG